MICLQVNRYKTNKSRTYLLILSVFSFAVQHDAAEGTLITFTGLKKKTDCSTVKEYFSRFGEISDIIVGADSSRVHNGLLKIRFLSVSSVLKMRKLTKHAVGGSTLKEAATTGPTNL